jgi:ATP-dependent RNA helicase DOB1
MDEDLFDVFDEPVAGPAASKPNQLQNQDIDISLDDDEEDAAIVNNVHETKRLRSDETGADEVVDDEEDCLTRQLESVVPKVEIHELETAGCVHEVVIPSDLTYTPLRDLRKEGLIPAKKYEFELDPFQKEGIRCIENNQSVLISAHTSAGKTVVAEYAIAQSLREKQRVVYTTPIKALSNQKYREFYEEFSDVGLITGDVTINPTASCLIMTTEILRLMLFRGSEIMREVGWVVFDEIHYMRDKERGVVWEETIILLPDSVHYVFLSATIPNARQFAEWIAHLHQQTCHVVYTDYRPTPLQHYIFPSGGDGLHMVMDENGNFKEDNFNLAMSKLRAAGDAAKGDAVMRGRRGGMKGESNCLKVVRTIMDKDLAPVIVFSFSKKDCEAYALAMAKLDFNTADEKDSVEEVFNNAIDVLCEEDKKLPQVEHVLPLLKRGIGIHHGGLLPIIKETIEILFGEGLIKALFATETFAMGLNMPARTVVFTNAQKFDGKDFRVITPGEYIQMSGRAGRRGLDDKGIVILMVDDKINPSVGKDLIKGKPDAINSAFHLTYNMVLNLLRVDDVNPEYMLQHSFYQFQHYSKVPELLQNQQEIEQQISKLHIQDENRVSDYFKMKEQLTTLSNQFTHFIQKPKYLTPFMQHGRLVKIVSNAAVDLGWAVVTGHHKKQAKKRREDVIVDTYSVDVLACLDKSVDGRSDDPIPPADGTRGEMKPITISFENIVRVSSVRIFVPEDLKSSDSRQSVLKSLTAIKDQFGGQVPVLDPVEDMKITDEEFKSLVKKIESFETRLLKFTFTDTQPLKLFTEKQELQEKLTAVRRELREAQSLIQMNELKCRKRVLRRMGYCSASDVIETKGRVACEITSGDELLLTEMLFNGVFNELTPHQINALLSCFVFEEKTDVIPKLTEELQPPLRMMQELAKRIAAVSRESKLELDEDEYIQKFRPNIMDVVYAWSQGSSFAKLCKMTDAFEGSIIRCMRRLEELLRQMCQAAKVIGNADLENKFAEADKCIKRDIVFAASLYL